MALQEPLDLRSVPAPDGVKQCLEIGDEAVMTGHSQIGRIFRYGVWVDVQWHVAVQVEIHKWQLELRIL